MKDVFISGWCGYPELFGDFADEFEFVVPFITHRVDDIHELLKCGGRNLIGWSTGAHIILDTNERPAFENIVLAAPFLKFTDYTPERILKRMIKRFDTFPKETVLDFFERCSCCASPSINPDDFDSLLNGLQYLLGSNIEEPNWSLKGVTVLHGETDLIVDVASSRRLSAEYGCDFAEIEGVGHYLPVEILRKYKI